MINAILRNPRAALLVLAAITIVFEVLWGPTGCGGESVRE